MINMKIAIIGDFHIPGRASRIPTKIENKLTREKPDLILCTGDLTNRETLEKLKNISNVKVVQGNMDKRPYPEKVKKERDGEEIMVIHGNQAVPRGNKERLIYIAKENNADILISGHTHQLNVEEREGILLLNPGSATGAWSGGGANPEPSFLTLKVQDQKAKIKKIYTDREEEEEHELN